MEGKRASEGVGFARADPAQLRVLSDLVKEEWLGETLDLCNPQALCVMKYTKPEQLRLLREVFPHGHARWRYSEAELKAEGHWPQRGGRRRGALWEDLRRERLSPVFNAQAVDRLLSLCGVKKFTRHRRPLGADAGHPHAVEVPELLGPSPARYGLNDPAERLLAVYDREDLVAFATRLLPCERPMPAGWEPRHPYFNVAAHDKQWLPGCLGLSWYFGSEGHVILPEAWFGVSGCQDGLRILSMRTPDRPWSATHLTNHTAGLPETVDRLRNWLAAAREKMSKDRLRWKQEHKGGW